MSVKQLERKFIQHVDEFQTLSVDSERTFRRDKLKKWIVSQFQGRLEFWRPRAANKSKLVFSVSISKGQLLESYVTLSASQEDIAYEDVASVQDDVAPCCTGFEE